MLCHTITPEGVIKLHYSKSLGVLALGKGGLVGVLGGHWFFFDCSGDLRKWSSFEKSTLHCLRLFQVRERGGGRTAPRPH